ncbi:hypothetical protein QBC46DRAFT_142185, partial [Diplogelasinospora grovesii]
MPTFRPNFVLCDNADLFVLSWLEDLDHCAPADWPHPTTDCEGRLHAPVSSHKPASPQQRCCRRPSSSGSTTMSPSREGSPSKRPRRETNDVSDIRGDAYGSTAVGDLAQVTPRPLRQPSFPSGVIAFPSIERADDPFVNAPPAAPFTNPPSLVHSASLPLRQVQSVTSRSESPRSSNTQRTGNSRRSKSPTKSPVRRVADLLFFDKPVEYRPQDRRSLPRDVKAMAEAIKGINL